MEELSCATAQDACSAVEERPFRAAFEDKSQTGFSPGNTYRSSGFVNMNDFTTIWLGCMPTGIMVSSEYSDGSNFFFGVRL